MMWRLTSKRISGHKQLTFLFLCLVATAILFMGLASSPEAPYRIAEVYMSCMAPKLSSLNSFLNIETSSCSSQVKASSIDTRLLMRNRGQFIAQMQARTAAGGTGGCSAPLVNAKSRRDSHPPVNPADSTAHAGNEPVVDTSSTTDSTTDSADGCVEWVTFSTKCSKNLNRLAALAHLTGVQFTILVPDDRIIIFTDADDVIPLPQCSAAHMAQTFLSHDTPVLFMAERECWPDISLKESYPKPTVEPTPFIYLNGGSYMGYAWALRDIIAEAYSIHCSDDQRGFTRAFLSGMSYQPINHHQRHIYSQQNNGRDLYPSQTTLHKSPIAVADHGPGRAYIKLDVATTLFQSLVHSRMEEFDFTKFNRTGRVEQLLTRNSPCIFHQNGNKHAAEMVLPKMVELLGLDSLWNSK
ncbi:hypothetical protein BASA61_000463 [Batrachochytrium salamandrivorans]|nr:hypothetical protein BASA61_000463 [Batrachochytrium salamandrivorans]